MTASRPLKPEMILYEKSARLRAGGGNRARTCLWFFHFLLQSKDSILEVCMLLAEVGVH